MNNTFYVNNSQIHGNNAFVNGDDFHHIKDVLRVKTNENVHICDENGNKYMAKLVDYTDKEAKFELSLVENGSAESAVNITLFQGLPKQDKMDMIVQKSTELGVFSIIPVTMDHSIVKLDDKAVSKKTDRWNKIAKEAASQSGRNKIPSILEPIIFKNIIENIGKYDIVLLPYENEQDMSIKQVLSGVKNVKSIAVIIGPEGGFSKDEIDLISSQPNVHLVSLGKRILRTETAGLATLAMLSYEFEL